MSDYIPIEIQSVIMKMLPVKSLLQFRSVSKEWKSLIDSSEFIQKYHLDNPNLQHHLLVRYNKLDHFTNIIDNNNTFPEHQFPLTIPNSISLLDHPLTIGSDKGLLCYFGSSHDDIENEMAVIWNPSIRKSVRIGIPNAPYRRTVVGFGVCPPTDTSDVSDPKLVKISVVQEPSMWVVDVFSLSKRVWEPVYKGAPFKSHTFLWIQVSIGGVMYWCAYDDTELDDDVDSDDDDDELSKSIISFDLKSNEFGEVVLPESLVYAEYLLVAKVNESLTLLQYKDEDVMSVCGVWMRKDGEDQPFTNIYNVEVKDRSVYNCVLGFRKNGEALLELEEEDNSKETEILVYEPLSGCIYGVGIVGKCRTFSVRSYMETLLLLDEPESSTIIPS